MDINNFIREYIGKLPYEEIGKKCGITAEAVRKRAQRMGITGKKKDDTEQFRDDKVRSVERKSESALAKKYRLALQELESKDKEIEALLQINKPVETYTIEPKKTGGHSEGVAFLIASDWHIEEPVNPEIVSGLNSYDLTESQRRAKLFFTRGLRLTEIVRRDVEINTIVIALLGDFITNSIHEDSMEDNLLSPVDAAIRCAEYLCSGIEFALEFTKDWDTKFYIPCHTGNHGRMTKERRVSTEAGNSLERMMYALIQKHFRDEKRVMINIASGYHSYFECYGATIRFHHGHAINYGGGVGGITIPINKAIAQWQRGRRADLDVFGHFHQFFDGGKFVANGSMIGYNAFALQVKAEFEKPKQAFFVWDKKRGKTWTAPILFH
jgi:hypothetical protein